MQIYQIQGNTDRDHPAKADNNLTFVRNVWAAKTFAGGGASGDSSRTLQVDHASG